MRYNDVMTFFDFVIIPLVPLLFILFLFLLVFLHYSAFIHPVIDDVTVSVLPLTHSLTHSFTPIVIFVDEL